MRQWRIQEEDRAIASSRSRKSFRFFPAKPNEKMSLHYFEWPQKLSFSSNRPSTFQKNAPILFEMHTQ
jgi:hypothetical protein